MSEHAIFEAGELRLESGTVLTDARLAYKTYGQLNRARDNAILIPTAYGGNHSQTEWLFQPGKALSMAEYFVIVPNMLGNGLSSSPSNTPAPFVGPDFPQITLFDNVQFQHQLVTDVFGIERLRLVAGWSMGGQQAYHWAAIHGEMVERMACICGSARTSRHNYIFLQGLKTALEAAGDFKGGRYTQPPVRGLRAFASIYAGWAWSQAFFREGLDRALFGAARPEDFIANVMESWATGLDANDLLAMLRAWQASDPSSNSRFSGDLAAALAAISARVLVMPSQTDLYFPPEDNQIEVGMMRNAELRIIPSIWGHMAGSGFNPVDAQFIDAALAELMAS